MQVNNAFLVPLPNALGIALAGGVLVLCYGVFGGTWQLMVLILRLRGFVTVEKIRRHFAKVMHILQIIAIIDEGGSLKNNHRHQRF